MAEKPIIERSAGRTTARLKLRPDERAERFVGAAMRLKVKTLDVDQARKSKYLGAKAKLQGTKSLLRGKLLAEQATRGRALTPEEKRAVVNPYRDSLRETFKDLPR